MSPSEYFLKDAPLPGLYENALALLTPVVVYYGGLYVQSSISPSTPASASPLRRRFREQLLLQRRPDAHHRSVGVRRAVLLQEDPRGQHPALRRRLVRAAHGGGSADHTGALRRAVSCGASGRAPDRR